MWRTTKFEDTISNTHNTGPNGTTNPSKSEIVLRKAFLSNHIPPGVAGSDPTYDISQFRLTSKKKRTNRLTFAVRLFRDVKKKRKKKKKYAGNFIIHLLIYSQSNGIFVHLYTSFVY